MSVTSGVHPVNVVGEPAKSIFDGELEYVSSGFKALYVFTMQFKTNPYESASVVFSWKPTKRQLRKAKQRLYRNNGEVQAMLALDKLIGGEINGSSIVSQAAELKVGYITAGNIDATKISGDKILAGTMSLTTAGLTEGKLRGESPQGEEQ